MTSSSSRLWCPDWAPHAVPGGQLEWCAGLAPARSADCVCGAMAGLSLWLALVVCLQQRLPPASTGPPVAGLSACWHLLSVPCSLCLPHRVFVEMFVSRGRAVSRNRGCLCSRVWLSSPSRTVPPTQATPALFTDFPFVTPAPWAAGQAVRSFPRAQWLPILSCHGCSLGGQ